MKVQNKLLSHFLVLAVIVFMISSCSKPMDTPVKASSINEYVKSVTEICKKLNNQDKEQFLYALEIVSIKFDIAVMSRLAGSPTFFDGGKAKDLMTSAAKDVDGKTPQEIINEAAALLKKKLIEAGKQVDKKTAQEILKMAKKQHIHNWITK